MRRRGGGAQDARGAVVDAGRFDRSDPKFRLFNEPDPSYHGLRHAKDLGELGPIAYALRMRLVPLSIGIENIDDILADLAGALDKA